MSKRNTILDLAATSYGNVLFLLMDKKELEQTISALLNACVRDYELKGDDINIFKRFLAKSFKDTPITIDKRKRISEVIIDYSIGLKTLCYFVFSAEKIFNSDSGYSMETINNGLLSVIQEENGNAIDEEIADDFEVIFIPWDRKHKEEIESIVNPKPGKGYRRTDDSVQPKAK